MSNEIIETRICTICGEEKPYTNEYFEKQRNQCKKCRAKSDKQRKSQKKRENEVMYKCKTMSTGAYSRIFADCRKDNINYKCYRNLVNPYGFANTVDLAEYLYDNFYDTIKELIDLGETPSIDRINPSIGCVKGNIQIISFKENTQRAVDGVKKKVFMKTPLGQIFIFDSVTKCVEYFGYKANNSSRVSSWCKKDGKYKVPKGYRFDYFQE